MDQTHTDWLHRTVHEYESRLVHYAWTIVGDVETARDVVQDAFLKLCREEPGAVGDPAGPWLFRVCRNRAIDHYRRRKREVPQEEGALDHAVSPGPQPDAQLIRQEQADQVLAVLATLPEREQEVVRLKFLHGLKYKEIAELTGLSATNVGFILHTALTKLRRQAAPEGRNQEKQS